MQRREQQNRARAAGGSGYMNAGSGNMGSYSPVPHRYEAPSPVPARTASPAASSLRSPAFKGSGMKLGSKKAKQAELLDAMGGVNPEEVSLPTTPAVPQTPEPVAVIDSRGSLPAVTAER